MAIGYGIACPKPPKRERKTPTRIRRTAKPKGERDRIAKVRAYIIARERNVCRCCRFRVGQSMHELLPRSRGGKISRTNSVWLCGDGVAGCHGLIQRYEILGRLWRTCGGRPDVFHPEIIKGDGLAQTDGRPAD